MIIKFVIIVFLYIGNLGGKYYLDQVLYLSVRSGMRNEVSDIQQMYKQTDLTRQYAICAKN